MRNDFESNYLAHHGILGQKWGKRNGPPYPLDSSQKSSSEKHKEKAKKYAKSAVGVAASAATIMAVGKVSKYLPISKGKKYFLYTFSKQMWIPLTIGVSSNLVASGAHYVSYKLKDSNYKVKK